MDNYADERDFLLLDKDKYTFFILRLVYEGFLEVVHGRAAGQHHQRKRQYCQYCYKPSDNPDNPE